MKKNKGLSDIEYELMTFFWEIKKPVTFSEVLDYCNQTKNWNWAKTTAHTHLTRLVKKKLLGIHDAPGVRRSYFAKITKEELAQVSALEFVNSSFSGSLKSFLLSLVPNKTLTQEEANELHEILDQLVKSNNSSEN